MNLMRFNKSTGIAARLAVMLVLFLFLPARGEDASVPGRWLLVFDTSATMKKVLPGTEAALKNFFATGADGQLQPGDSVAVWLVNQQINGQFPALTVGATNAGIWATNLGIFLHRQKYSTASQLPVLQTPLNRIVANSRRLTVLIFTDGQSEIAGTPYDDGVNQTFRDVQADRRKSQQPVVVMMRGQFGKFVGCTLGFPPANISFPPFPALPLPPPVVTNVAKVASPPVTPAPAASLVIVGNQVITNSSASAETLSAPAAPVVVTNPPVVAPVMATNSATAVSTANPAASSPVPARAIAEPPVKVESPPDSVEKLATVAASPAVSSAAPLPNISATKIVATDSNPPALVAGIAQSPVAPPSPSAKLAVVAAANAVAATAAVPPSQPRIFIYAGIGGLAVIGVFLVIWMGRSRRPQPSLISRSLEDDSLRE